MKFKFPILRFLEWIGENFIPTGRIIFVLQACMFISKWYLCHIVIVKDLDSIDSPIESVPVVREFTEVFPNYLLGVPPEWKIKFSINLLLDTNPTSIPSYPTVLAELK